MTLDSTQFEQINHRPEFQEPSALSTSSPDLQNLKFEREDWSLFRTVEGLQQKAGVPRNLLPRLVLKELADNGLDDDAWVEVGQLPENNGYFVDDNGHGIDGTPEQIARLFSIARPMVSSKLLRLPTRGALGNGLRVVAGAVLASEGSLTVTTRNRRIVLRPERDGSTTVVSATRVERPVGTRIEIRFGAALPSDQNPLLWAHLAGRLANLGESYSGKSSPWWYDTPQFNELLYASGRRPVRDLIAHLDGCSGAKAGEIVAQAGLGRALCADVTQAQAAKLLKVARESARPVKPQRLGAIGAMGQAFFGEAYACTHGVKSIGSAKPAAEIPYVVEAWADKTDGATSLMVCVNRTPVTGTISAARDKREINALVAGSRTPSLRRRRMRTSTSS